MNPTAAAPPPLAAGPLFRWARFAARRPRHVIAVWLAALALLAVLSQTVGGEYVDDFTLPGAESQRALDVLEERFPAAAGDSATIVVRADSGVADPAVRPRIEALVAAAASLPQVAGVVSPYDDPSAVSADGRFAYASVQYPVAAADLDDANVERLGSLVDGAAADGFQAEVGGTVAALLEDDLGHTAEIVGLAAAAVILLVAFGSIVAAGLPIVTALVGLGTSILLLRLLAGLLDLSTLTTVFVAMIGLGVGIDYALFVVTRFREGLRAGLGVEGAVVRAVDTAGRAVAFAGAVVAIALLGLLAIGIPLVGYLGLAAAVGVVGSALVALTLLPSLQAVVGTRIDRWSFGRRAADGDGGEPGWVRWSRRVQRRPLGHAAAAVGVLLLLALPFFDLRLGSADDGNKPEQTHARRAYDLLADGFGPGFNGPLVVSVEQEGGIDPAALDRLGDALGAWAGVGWEETRTETGQGIAELKRSLDMLGERARAALTDRPAPPPGGRSDADGSEGTPPAP